MLISNPVLSFTTLITTKMIISFELEMNQKDLFLKEVIEKVGDKLGSQRTTEKVEQFAKHGTLFLFFEIISLRHEVERLKKEVEYRE